MPDEFDPQAPEDRRSSDLMSRKDWRVVAIVLFFLALIGWPIYLKLAADANKALCKRNMRKIGAAMGEYTNDFDGRLPFAYETTGFESTEVRLRDHLAYTWQWQLQRYTRDWSVFACPAAEEAEHTKTSDGFSVHVSDYGMLAGFSGIDTATVANPDRSFIVGETSNFGSLNSYDPLPIQVEGSPLRNDGFMIGFDNDQIYPNEQTKQVTRLAFRDVGKGNYNSDSRSRHPGGIFMLTLDGGIRTIEGNDANVKRFGGSYGPWTIPKPLPLGR